MPRPLDELLVVSHTHWDREWYHPAAVFRQRLVALVEELLDDPPPRGQSFLLDGQGIVLDDYLTVRPERAAELSQLLRERRLEAGPWYVLPDELLPSGEALVRNLLLGRETVRRLRGATPPVLYCPDSFGHPAALPELAAGFGCDVIVSWRGFGGTRWPAGDCAWWRAPSGAVTLLYHLPPDGYEFGASLPLNAEDARERWNRLRDVVAPRATSGAALLLNGADHHARQRSAGESITALARAAMPVRVTHCSLAAASVALVERARAHGSLPDIVGELRDSYGFAWTLQGTLGSRTSQKRRNAQAEALLVRDTEPWIALGDAASPPSTRALLRVAWRDLLACHPHDTLCGTSIDEVARSVDARLDSVKSQAGALRHAALNVVVGHDTERARNEIDAWRPMVDVRNRAARPRSGIVELVLRAPRRAVRVGPGSAETSPNASPAPRWGVSGMRLQLLPARDHVRLTESPRAYPRADLVAERHALGWIAPVPGYGVRTLQQGGRHRPLAELPMPVRTGPAWLENEHLRIELGDAGRVDVIHLASRWRMRDVCALERERDAGDLYTPAIREPLDAPRFVRARFGAKGPLRAELHLEHRTSVRDERCQLTLRLDAGARWVALRVDGINGTTDQRLRLRMRTGLEGGATIADAAFRSVERVPIHASEIEQRAERVVPTAPLHRYVTRFAPHAGATVVSDGLAEYESRDNGDVLITLVRSVGELSRADLPERPGHAGWPAPTPQAQCLGAFSASFALCPHDADSPAVRDEIERLAEDVLLPLVGETRYANLGECGDHGGLELSGEGLAFSAAAPAQRAGWLVLRCVNRRAHLVSGSWRIARDVQEAWLARLDETPLEMLAIRDEGVILFSAAPFAIVTVLLR